MNKTITTPNGTSVELKGWLSGRDQREFRKTLVSLDNISKAESLELVENIVLSTVVVSVGGSTENILDAVLNLPSEDYSFVLDESNQIIQGLTKKKEEISSSDITDGSKENQ